MGGITGHLKHLYEYDSLDGRELGSIVTNLMLGRIAVTEKVDGLNIQVSMDSDRNIVFIRNNGDINSAKGGMSIEDIFEKWKDNDEVRNCYLYGASELENILCGYDPTFFNPDVNTKRALNVECVCGQTNVIPYACKSIYIHNVFVYKRTVKGWVNTDIENLPADLERFKSPILTIKGVDLSTVNDYLKLLYAVIPMDMTIKEYKFNKFIAWCKEFEPWILEEEYATDVLFHRWFQGIKEFNLKELKKIYGDNADRLVFLDKGFRHIVNSVMKDLDKTIITIGQVVLGACKGYINEGSDINMLTGFMDAVDALMESDNEEIVFKLNKQLERLNGVIYPFEGIVFEWNGMLIKMTGNFAPYNQIMGMIRFGR